MNKTKAIHLERPEGTENNVRTVKWKCGGAWNPCKRMDCSGCAERRGNYFVEAGALMATKLGIDRHVVISWPLMSSQCHWEKLRTQAATLSKNLAGRIGPFVRSLAIGDQQTPHAHYLVRFDRVELAYETAHRCGPAETRVYVDKDSIYDIAGLLDYLYRQNFLPTINDPERIKGMRLLSGSRGITYSYPRKKNFIDLQNIREMGWHKDSSHDLRKRSEQ